MSVHGDTNYYFRQDKSRQGSASSKSICRGIAPEVADLLSNREQDVLELIAQGPIH